MNTPSYYAIIPANVRYDKDLKPNEKLLYGEITCLANKQGYCFATNSYFAELYNVNKATVSRWISHLIEKGYIKSEIILNGKSVDERRIYLTSFAKITPIDEKIKTPIDEKIKTPIDEKIKDNNTRKNNINFNINSSAEPSSEKSSPYDFLIAQYLILYKELYEQGKVKTEKPYYNDKQVKKQIDNLLQSLTVTDLYNILLSAKNDSWIVSNGFSLSIIYSHQQINKLLNGVTPAPKTERQKKDHYTDEEYWAGMSDLDTIGF